MLAGAVDVEYTGGIGKRKRLGTLPRYSKRRRTPLKSASPSAMVLGSPPDNTPAISAAMELSTMWWPGICSW